jgi:galactokinase
MSIETLTIGHHLAKSISEKFSVAFGFEPSINVRSAGRINLIGEHTDYNNGFVLPAAIGKSIFLSVSVRQDDEIHLVSYDLDQHYTCSLHNIIESGKHWPDYLLGVVVELQKRQYDVKGFNCVFGGDIPLGAGLSSSAAVECATIFALNELFAFDISKLDMVKMAQAAENNFVGVQCGIMDQFASMFGKKEHLVKLDCASLKYEYIPFHFKDINIVLFDTQVKHSLASSEYNTRRQECERAVALISKHHPEVKSLRDVNTQMLDEYVKHVDDVAYTRSMYVVEEILRLQNACEDLFANDLVAFGKKMFATHEGLSKMYEVSCTEADWLVDAVQNEPDVLGARMMGGGFGGCTINLVKNNAVDALARKITALYKQRFNVDLKTYITNIEDGCSLV